jgi:AcrR family transcriptional regulator
MGRKRGITVEGVLQVAQEIADADGLDAVTLAAVAERIGVRSPSLYAHVKGLDDLRRRLALRAAEAMANAFRAAAKDKEGLAAMRALIHGYRIFASHHPGLYAAAQRAVRPGEDDELYRSLAAVAAPVVGALAEAGVPTGERIHLTRGIRAALHGFAELERNAGFGMPESIDESFDRLADLLIAGVQQAGR